MKIFHRDLVNLYGCEIGDNTKIGAFVEIQKNSEIGKNCKISSHSFICEGVRIDDDVFVGHGVKFINDKYPKSTTSGIMQTEKDWKVVPTLVKKGASIGTNATILCGVIIGENAIIGAGSVVTKDVPPNSKVYGNPAREKIDNMKIPFLDLKAQYLSIKSEIDEAIQKTLDNSTFVLGPDIENFEKDFAKFCNVNYAVAVNSGTAALHLALLSVGIKEGDEVITVPNSFIATAEAISHCGAIPVFCDINEKTYNLDENLIESKITNKTKAIVPVHLYGNPCNMDKINEIAEKYGLVVIEDACQAHGAEYKNQRTGSLSDIAVFSFYPGKNLGAYGEGGMITTNNKELADKCRLYRAHGENPKNTHLVIGYNYRLEGMQGAILGVKLKHLAEWNNKRRKNAEIYSRLLKDFVITPEISQENKSVFHVYAIRHPQRNKLKEFLQERGISTGIHYEKPIHLQKAYSFLKHKLSDFPISEKVMGEVLSLPMYPELTQEQIEYVCKQIKEFEKINP